MLIGIIGYGVVGKALENTLSRKFNIVKELKLRGVPTTVFINKKGEEFARVIGSMDFEEWETIQHRQRSLKITNHAYRNMR